MIGRFCQRLKIADRVLYLDDGRLSEGVRPPVQAVRLRAFATQ